MDGLAAPGFHHLHLNSVDPDTAIDFYVRQFPTSGKARWGGFSALTAPNNALGAALAASIGVDVSRETNAIDLLRRPELDYATLMRVPQLGPGVDDAKVAEQVEIETKYAGYLNRQREEIARQQRNEATAIPDAFDYALVRGLSAEVQQKLNHHRPETVGQAARISGVTPAAISLLLVHLKRGFRGRDKKRA